jgi:phosphate transport system substrate-binding protein
MKRKGFALLTAVTVALLATAAAGAKHSSTTLFGAGSSFVSPLVSTWKPALGGAFDYTIEYSPNGSGAGISAITNRLVDFGASDAPLTPDQFTACNGCVQIPWALAGTAIPYNVPGITPASAAVHLHLSGDVLAKIFMGTITNWNDAAIKALNPTATMPDLKITPVYRTGNSGTTYNFTDYLTSVSPAWKSAVGSGQSVSWPAGTGASGSAGVTGVVTNTPGAICYVDTAFALANKLHFAAIQNRAGKFIYPSIRNVAEAGGTVTTVPAGNELHIVNPTKKYPKAYPIATYTYIILPTSSKNAAALKRMTHWALTTGQQTKYTAKLWFAPIPRVVLIAAEKSLKTIQPTT